MATVSVTPEAQNDLAALPEPIIARVQRILVRLKDRPHVSGAKPLRGALKGHWRMRTGDYRVQFHVAGETVIVERIGHRDGFYDD